MCALVYNGNHLPYQNLIGVETTVNRAPPELNKLNKDKLRFKFWVYDPFIYRNYLCLWCDWKEISIKICGLGPSVPANHFKSLSCIFLPLKDNSKLPYAMRRMAQGENWERLLQQIHALFIQWYKLLQDCY